MILLKTSKNYRAVIALKIGKCWLMPKRSEPNVRKSNFDCKWVRWSHNKRFSAKGRTFWWPHNISSDPQKGYETYFSNCPKIWRAKNIVGKISEQCFQTYFGVYLSQPYVLDLFSHVFAVLYISPSPAVITVHSFSEAVHGLCTQWLGAGQEFPPIEYKKDHPLCTISNPQFIRHKTSFTYAPKVLPSVTTTSRALASTIASNTGIKNSFNGTWSYEFSNTSSGANWGVKSERKNIHGNVCKYIENRGFWLSVAM